MSRCAISPTMKMFIGNICVENVYWHDRFILLQKKFQAYVIDCKYFVVQTPYAANAA